MSSPTEESKERPEEKAKKEKKKPISSLPARLLHMIEDHFIDSMAYILLALSLLYSLFRPFTGGAIVGFILGLYLSAQILSLSRTFRNFLLSDGTFKGFVLMAAVVALVISAPGLCLGTVLGTIFRALSQAAAPSEEPEEKENTEKKAPPKE